MPDHPEPVSLPALGQAATKLLSSANYSKIYQRSPDTNLPELTVPLATAEAALSTLNQLATVGEPKRVAEIIQRLFDMYPQSTVKRNVAEDWVRVLADEPLGAIWMAYDHAIRQPGKWMPSLGDFLQEVRVQSRLIVRRRRAISTAIRSHKMTGQPWENRNHLAANG